MNSEELPAVTDEDTAGYMRTVAAVLDSRGDDEAADALRRIASMSEDELNECVEQRAQRIREMYGAKPKDPSP